jgi:hypothetical protein
MNTANAENSAKATPDIALRDPMPAPVEHKITAEQIKMGCPARLQHLGEQITKRFERAREHAKLLDEEVIGLQKLIAEAKELCDKEGFVAFREKFFPNLRKSRVYELLAVVREKKSLADQKASTRERVAKHRAKQAASVNSVLVTENLGDGADTAEPAAVPLSVTVTENLEYAPSAPPVDDACDDGAPLVPEPRPVGTRSKIATGDRPIIEFSSTVMELVRRTKNKDVEHFAKTSVSVRDLAQLGKFFTDIANFKSSSSLEQMQALPDDTARSNSEASSNAK